MTDKQQHLLKMRGISCMEQILSMFDILLNPYVNISHTHEQSKAVKK
jgi:hypothetical protein